MLQELIDKYTKRLANLMRDWESLEAGVIPHADVEGAPETLNEARFAVSGLIFACEAIITDLNILLMEQLFSEVGTPGDTGEDAAE